jgi:hypothetical protein
MTQLDSILLTAISFPSCFDDAPKLEGLNDTPKLEGLNDTPKLEGLKF